MDKFGLIGDPIAKSKSPMLFNAGYCGKYTYDLIEGSDFETSWNTFVEGYKAINVTAPFKENAFRKVIQMARAGKADIAGPVMKIGATNLIVKHDDGSIESHNSDFPGIIMSVAGGLFPGIVEEFCSAFGTKAYIKIHQFVRQSLEQLYGRKPQALIVGCGGAGKAAAVAAAEMGFETALMNRTPEKAQAIVDALPEYNFINVPISDFIGSVKECDLVIYTLPMKIDAIDSLTIEDFAGEDREGVIGASKIVFEANYKSPSFSGEVRQRLDAAGCQYIPGSKWLAYQAVTGYGIMTGEEPDAAAICGCRF